MGARATGSGDPRPSAAPPRAGPTGSTSSATATITRTMAGTVHDRRTAATSSATAAASVTNTSTRSHGSSTCTSVYPAPGTVRLLFESSRAILAEPVLPCDHEQEQRGQHEHVSVCSACGGDRRRLCAYGARRDVPGHCGDKRDCDASRTATGTPSGTAGGRRRRIRRPCGTADRRSRTPGGVAQSASCCQSARTTLLPTKNPAAAEIASDPASSDCRSRAVRGSRRGSRASAGAVRATSQRLREEDGRGGDPGKAARQPLGREQGPEDPLLPELVEPQPIRLEVRRRAGEHRQHPQRPQQDRGAHPRPRPPAARP